MGNVQQKVLLPDGTVLITTPSNGNGTLKLKAERTGNMYCPELVASAAQRMGMRIDVNDDGMTIIFHRSTDSHRNRTAVIRSFEEQIRIVMTQPPERRQAIEQLEGQARRNERWKLLEPRYEPRPEMFAGR